MFLIDLVSCKWEAVNSRRSPSDLISMPHRATTNKRGPCITRPRTDLLRRDAELLGEPLLLRLVGVGVLPVPLQPPVEAVVHVLGQPRVLHAQLVLQLHGARVLLPQLVPHARRQHHLREGRRLVEGMGGCAERPEKGCKNWKITELYEYSRSSQNI